MSIPTSFSTNQGHHFSSPPDGEGFHPPALPPLHLFLQSAAVISSGREFSTESISSFAFGFEFASSALSFKDARE